MRVALVDLLTMAPFYDRSLAQALVPLVDELMLYAISFHLDPRYLADLPFRRSARIVDLVSQMGVCHRALRRAAKVAEYVVNWAWLLVQWRALRPDILHIQWLPLLLQSGLELRFLDLAWRLGIPLVYTIHNLWPHDEEIRPRMWARYKRLYTMADALIVHTTVDRVNLISQFDVPASKVFQVRQGPVLCEHAFCADQAGARRELGWDESWFTFLMLGVIRPYKGIETALRALAILVPHDPDVRLVVAGQGQASHISSLLRLASELNVTRHVLWDLAYVSVERVSLYHAASDVVLLPYRSVSQSGALLTAAGHASCVLAADVGGLAEVIRDGKTGILWRSQEPVELAERMHHTTGLAPQERRAIGSRLRDMVLREYNWDDIAAQTVQVYHWASAQRATGSVTEQ